MSLAHASCLAHLLIDLLTLQWRNPTLLDNKNPLKWFKIVLVWLVSENLSEYSFIMIILRLLGGLNLLLFLD